MTRGGLNSTFVRCIYKLNKQPVQETQKQCAYLSVTVNEDTVTYTFMMARWSFKLLSKVKGNKPNQKRIHVKIQHTNKQQQQRQQQIYHQQQHQIYATICS